MPYIDEAAQRRMNRGRALQERGLDRIVSGLHSIGQESARRDAQRAKELREKRENAFRVLKVASENEVPVQEVADFMGIDMRRDLPLNSPTRDVAEIEEQLPEGETDLSLGDPSIPVGTTERKQSLFGDPQVQAPTQQPTQRESLLFPGESFIGKFDKGVQSRQKKRERYELLQDLKINELKRKEKEAGLPYSETTEGKRFLQKKEAEATGIKSVSTKDFQNIQEGAQIPALLDDVQKTLDANIDIFGFLEGNLRSLNPNDVKAQSIQAEFKAASQAFGRFMEGGVLRKEDEVKYEKMFPQLGDNPEVAKNKLTVVRRIMAKKYNGLMDALNKGGFNTKGLPQGLDVPEQVRFTGPKKGEVMDGYEFLGGDPSKKENWKKK